MYRVGGCEEWCEWCVYCNCNFFLEYEIAEQDSNTTESDLLSNYMDTQAPPINTLSSSSILTTLNVQLHNQNIALNDAIVHSSGIVLLYIQYIYMYLQLLIEVSSVQTEPITIVNNAHLIVCKQNNN
jgi:hypothetical protein